LFKARKTRTKSPVHSGFNEQRQPLLRGDARDYVIARADRVAFVAEVVRFGFSRADFALAIPRFRGKRSPTRWRRLSRWPLRTFIPDVARPILVDRAERGLRSSFWISSKGRSAGRCPSVPKRPRNYKRHVLSTCKRPRKVSPGAGADPSAPGLRCC